jgi:hypothetical protein
MEDAGEASISNPNPKSSNGQLNSSSNMHATNTSTTSATSTCTSTNTNTNCNRTTTMQLQCIKGGLPDHAAEAAELVLAVKAGDITGLVNGLQKGTHLNTLDGAGM